MNQIANICIPHTSVYRTEMELSRAQATIGRHEFIMQSRRNPINDVEKYTKLNISQGIHKILLYYDHGRSVGRNVCMILIYVAWTHEQEWEEWYSVTVTIAYFWLDISGQCESGLCCCQPANSMRCYDLWLTNVSLYERLMLGQARIIFFRKVLKTLFKTHSHLFSILCSCVRVFRRPRPVRATLSATMNCRMNARFNVAT